MCIPLRTFHFADLLTINDADRQPVNTNPPNWEKKNMENPQTKNQYHHLATPHHPGPNNRM